MLDSSVATRALAAAVRGALPWSTVTTVVSPGSGITYADNSEACLGAEVEVADDALRYHLVDSYGSPSDGHGWTGSAAVAVRDLVRELGATPAERADLQTLATAVAADLRSRLPATARVCTEHRDGEVSVWAGLPGTPNLGIEIFRGEATLPVFATIDDNGIRVRLPSAAVGGLEECYYHQVDGVRAVASALLAMAPELDTDGSAAELAAEPRDDEGGTDIPFYGFWADLAYFGGPGRVTVGGRFVFSSLLIRDARPADADDMRTVIAADTSGGILISGYLIWKIQTPVTTRAPATPPLAVMEFKI